LAASTTKEERAYSAAVAAFQDGMWNRAETEFAQFLDKYKTSSHLPDAVLMMAQAKFKQGKLAEAVSLLNLGKADAGALADQYAYWIGEAQFENGDFDQAADTFVSLSRDFPNSLLRLRAVVEAASAQARLGKWSAVRVLLEGPGGVFQRAAEMDSANELISRGRLLLAQAKFVQKDFNGASALLQLLAQQPLKLELDWQRAYLLCQVKISAGDLEGALAAADNLAQVAQLSRDDAMRAESSAMRAGVLEKLQRADEAIAAYRENLTNTVSIERQRQAVLKIAQLAFGQQQFSPAEDALSQYGLQFTNSPARDIVLLTLGELHLRDYLSQSATTNSPAATNHITQALAAYDQFIGAFTNSPLLGKAYLGRGWALWLADKIPASYDSFKLASQKLPLSVDTAVARFKMGDTLFLQKDFSGARQNYQAVLNDFTALPSVLESLGSRALYQSLRASLELNDIAGANAALEQMLRQRPTSRLANNSLLLVGEATVSPADARVLFQKYREMYPLTILRPQVELAIARTYEQEGNWPQAIQQYASWQQDFKTNALRPQADYALAWATFQTGEETNAFLLFTNFIAQFPTNELAPQAQWWVADHFYRAGDFVAAEKNYQLLFQLWPTSGLTFEARMMAGRAAMGRTDYAGAIRDYFSPLEEEARCPIELRVKATFAHGVALMRMDSSDTNKPLANFEAAAAVFGQICNLYDVTNELGVLAWGERANCYLQLGAQDASYYDKAASAYTLVFATNSPANIFARSQAQVGFGITLEKKAALAAGDDRMNLLKQALDSYLFVFDTWTGENLRDGEVADPFWVRKAGLQAAALSESLGEWAQAVNIYRRLEELLPPLKESLEKKIIAAQEHLSAQKS